MGIEREPDGTVTTHDLGLSIGALAKAVGVAVETLRTWERRYGQPVPHRLPSGHRRYSLDTVDRLRLVTALIERGHKPSEVVPLDEAALARLAGLAEPPPESTSPEERWFEAARTMDEQGMLRRLETRWARLDIIGFLDGFLAPLLIETGERWARGELTIAQEHFASEIVAQFLIGRWRPMSAVQDGPVAVAATPSGERHSLGLHMAALALAAAGWQIRFLGADTPDDDIVAAADATGARAVVLGASPSLARAQLEDTLSRLHRSLGERAIWCGGTAPVERPGISWATNLAELYHWAREQAAG